jgi:DNA replication protein DnaC
MPAVSSCRSPSSFTCSSHDGGTVRLLLSRPCSGFATKPARMLKALARVDLLILDDWGPEKLDDDQRRDLLDIVEDRYERRTTIVTSQIPVDRWYEIIGNPTIADAILDRLVHNAYRIELSGESLRKQRSPAAASSSD